MTETPHRFFSHFSCFILLSILLHLASLALLRPTAEHHASKEQTPFTVDLRDFNKRPRELDLPTRTESQRVTPAKRLGPQDQVATRESAPTGGEARDTTPQPAPSPQRPSPPATAPGTTSKTAPPPPLFDPFKSGERAAQSIADLDPLLRQKLRNDVAQGKAVWLDTEKDILGSFYLRFRKGIYAVWNYPTESARHGEQGVSLIKIVINRAGLVQDADILTTSGFSRLDNEALQAIHEASPLFGYLPASYPDETLTIYAFFEYRLGGGVNLYGEPLRR